MHGDHSGLLNSLNALPLLSGLLPDDRRLLAELGGYSDLPGGAVITDEGAPVSRLWFLIDGRAAVEIGSGAARALLATLEPGAVLGEASYLSGRGATASVTTLCECRLIEFSQSKLRRFCEEQPSFGLRFERLLTGILQERFSRAIGRGRSIDLPVVDAASLKGIQRLSFLPLEEAAIEAYSRYGHRDAFLWRWCLRAIELTALPCLPADWRDEVRALKLLAAITIVTVDDVADVGQTTRELDELLGLLGDGCLAEVQPVLDSRLREGVGWIWSELCDRTRRLPMYSAFAGVLAFDWRMVFTANRHARLSREVAALLNPTENLDYAPHGIGVLVFSTLDLMGSRSPGAEDLRSIREVVHAGQTLCELANMIATWRREIPDRDFGSRIFMIGLARGTFTRDELMTLPPENIIARVQENDLEGFLLAEWRSHRARAEMAAARIRSFDPTPLLTGYDAVFGMTLAARGSI